MTGRWAWLVVELTLLFLVVSSAVHLVQRRLGTARLQRWMGGRPVVAALKGITVGFFTPFCTYSAIPMLVGMRRAGVTPAGYVAFIVAAPVLDPILFGALVLIVGVPAAATYVIVAFTAAMTLALAAERFGVSRHLRPLPDPVLVGATAPGASVAITTGPLPTAEAACAVPEADGPAWCGGGAAGDWRGLAAEIPGAARSALRLFRSLGPILLLGVALGIAIEIVVPPEAAAGLTGDGVLAIPAAAALGTPLYFGTELFVPIADSLRSVGVGVGAIVALTIAGAGANLPEFLILGRMARAKVLALFVAYVFAVAVVGGVLAEVIAA